MPRRTAAKDYAYFNPPPSSASSSSRPPPTTAPSWTAPPLSPSTSVGTHACLYNLAEGSSSTLASRTSEPSAAIYPTGRPSPSFYSVGGGGSGKGSGSGGGGSSMYNALGGSGVFSGGSAFGSSRGSATHSPSHSVHPHPAYSSSTFASPQSSQRPASAADAPRLSQAEYHHGRVTLTRPPNMDRPKKKKKKRRKPGATAPVAVTAAVGNLGASAPPSAATVSAQAGGGIVTGPSNNSASRGGPDSETDEMDVFRRPALWPGVQRPASASGLLLPASASSSPFGGGQRQDQSTPPPSYMTSSRPGVLRIHSAGSLGNLSGSGAGGIAVSEPAARTPRSSTFTTITISGSGRMATASQPASQNTSSSTNADAVAPPMTSAPLNGPRQSRSSSSLPPASSHLIPQASTSRGTTATSVDPNDDNGDENANAHLSSPHYLSHSHLRSAHPTISPRAASMRRRNVWDEISAWEAELDRIYEQEVDIPPPFPVGSSAPEADDAPASGVRSGDDDADHMAQAGGRAPGYLEGDNHHTDMAEGGDRSVPPVSVPLPSSPPPPFMSAPPSPTSPAPPGAAGSASAPASRPEPPVPHQHASPSSFPHAASAGNADAQFVPSTDAEVESITSSVSEGSDSPKLADMAPERRAWEEDIMMGLQWEERLRREEMRREARKRHEEENRNAVVGIATRADVHGAGNGGGEQIREERESEEEGVVPGLGAVMESGVRETTVANVDRDPAGELHGQSRVTPVEVRYPVHQSADAEATEVIGAEPTAAPLPSNFRPERVPTTPSTFPPGRAGDDATLVSFPAAVDPNRFRDDATAAAVRRSRLWANLPPLPGGGYLVSAPPRRRADSSVTSSMSTRLATQAVVDSGRGSVAVSLPSFERDSRLSEVPRAPPALLAHVGGAADDSDENVDGPTSGQRRAEKALEYRHARRASMEAAEATISAARVGTKAVRTRAREGSLVESSSSDSVESDEESTTSSEAYSSATTAMRYRVAGEDSPLDDEEATSWRREERERKREGRSWLRPSLQLGVDPVRKSLDERLAEAVRRDQERMPTRAAMALPHFELASHDSIAEKVERPGVHTRSTAVLDVATRRHSTIKLPTETESKSSDESSLSSQQHQQLPQPVASTSWSNRTLSPTSSFFPLVDGPRPDMSRVAQARARAQEIRDNLIREAEEEIRRQMEKVWSSGELEREGGDAIPEEEERGDGQPEANPEAEVEAKADGLSRSKQRSGLDALERRLSRLSAPSTSEMASTDAPLSQVRQDGSTSLTEPEAGVQEARSLLDKGKAKAVDAGEIEDEDIAAEPSNSGRASSFATATASISEFAPRARQLPMTSVHASSSSDVPSRPTSSVADMRSTLRPSLPARPVRAIGPNAGSGPGTTTTPSILAYIPPSERLALPPPLEPTKMPPPASERASFEVHEGRSPRRAAAGRVQAMAAMFESQMQGTLPPSVSSTSSSSSYQHRRPPPPPPSRGRTSAGQRGGQAHFPSSTIHWVDPPSASPSMGGLDRHISLSARSRAMDALLARTGMGTGLPADGASPPLPPNPSGADGVHAGAGSMGHSTTAPNPSLASMDVVGGGADLTRIAPLPGTTASATSVLSPSFVSPTLSRPANGPLPSNFRLGGLALPAQPNHVNAGASGTPPPPSQASSGQFGLTSTGPDVDDCQRPEGSASLQRHPMVAPPVPKRPFAVNNAPSNSSPVVETRCSPAPQASRSLPPVPPAKLRQSVRSTPSEQAAQLEDLVVARNVVPSVRRPADDRDGLMDNDTPSAISPLTPPSEDRPPARPTSSPARVSMGSGQPEGRSAPAPLSLPPVEDVGGISGRDELSTSTPMREPLAAPFVSQEACAEEQRCNVGLQQRRPHSPESSFTYTELDVLLSRLEGEGDHYDELVTLAEVLGPANPHSGHLSPDELSRLPIAPVMCDRRRIDKEGKVKQKLSVVGVRVDKCGICLGQFRPAVLLPSQEGSMGSFSEGKRGKGQWGCILGCGHIFHDTCAHSHLSRGRLCPLCRTDAMMSSSTSRPRTT